MLKKPKTKYSYVRRIAALPVVFMLCFFYLINAKNREIKTTNAQIEQIVAEIKRDTVPPPPPPVDAVKAPAAPNVPAVKGPKVPQENISLNNSAESVPVQVTINNAKTVKIAEEIREKSEALRKLLADQRTESSEAKKLEQELHDLGSKMKEVHESADFKNSMEEMKKSHLEMDRVHAKMEAYHNSAEFKNRIKDAEKRAREPEKMVNSAEFKKRIRQAEKRAKDADRIVNSPEFKQRMREAEKRVAETERIMNSPEFRERINHAETAGQTAAEEAAKKAGSTVRYDREGRRMYIFYDGKEITQEEMNKIDPKNIESMNVIKKGYEGNNSGEIHIKSKK